MQTKNITKVLLFAFLGLFAGEGVFGLGFYWPYLFLLVDWPFVYWFAFGFGLIVSLVVGVGIGIPSLILILSVLIGSFLMGTKKSTVWILPILSVLCNLLLDSILGLNWSFGEALLILGLGLIVIRGWDKQEVIKINF